ncbi:MAG TPA: class I SAM-dependent methyltransferase [Thermosulfurimonas dismutans]|uniref:Class I SAM-dependent methyltransferase n=1 Tax=Thermosulfurimonas dismutans TaxID=999894 RepID=A0A7C3CLH1_9BACT|nr:class I SAM-dependent methyltransferase [Thermosulfurimonas dismutans]
MKETPRVFDQLARDYDHWYEKPFGRSVYALELSALRRVCRDFRRGLEVGVGTGRFALPLGIPYGADPSLEMLRLARKRGLTVVQAAGENLPFVTGGFDLVLLMVTLCFVDSPEAVLREAHRVLGPGGRLVLGLILRESPWAAFYQEKGRRGHPLYQRAHFYSLPELRELLSRTGFKEKRILSTLFEPPQTERPITNQEIREGFHPQAGFFILLALKSS